MLLEHNLQQVLRGSDLRKQRLTAETVRGAGMTTKYMPLWLFEKVHMSPVGLNFVQALMPLCVALASVFAQELADYIGASPMRG